MGRATPMLRCLGEHDITLFLVEVHQGANDSYINGWALVPKLLREGY